MTLRSTDPAAAILPFLAPLDELRGEAKREALLQAYDAMGRTLADLRSVEAAGAGGREQPFDFEAFAANCVDRIVECHVASGLVDPEFDALATMTLLGAFQERLAATGAAPATLN